MNQRVVRQRSVSRAALLASSIACSATVIVQRISHAFQRVPVRAAKTGTSNGGGAAGAVGGVEMVGNGLLIAERLYRRRKKSESGTGAALAVYITCDPRIRPSRPGRPLLQRAWRRLPASQPRPPLPPAPTSDAAARRGHAAR